MATIKKGKFLITEEGKPSKLSDVSLVAVVGVTKEQADKMVKKDQGNGVEIPKEDRGTYVNLQVDTIVSGVSIPKSIKESAKDLTGEARFKKITEGLQAKGIDTSNVKYVVGDVFEDRKKTKYKEMIATGLSDEDQLKLVKKDQGNGVELPKEERSFFKKVGTQRITDKEDGFVVTVPKSILDEARKAAGVESGSNTPEVYKNIEKALVEKFGISFDKKEPEVKAQEVSEEEIPSIDR